MLTASSIARPALLLAALAVGACRHLSPAPESAATAPRDSVSPENAAEPLAGSSWVLEDINGAGVLDDARATLEFSEAGKVSGRGSCNRFFGTAEVEGSRIHLGPLGTTRMACPEAVMDQERRYLERLQQAERFAVEADVLRIFGRDSTASLRFRRDVS